MNTGAAAGATPRTAAQRPGWHLAILAIGIVSAVAACHAIATAFGAPGLVGPLAASAFLAVVLPDSPLASPRAVLGGHVLGVLAAIATGWLVAPACTAVAVAPGLALLAMLGTRSAHAPAAATPVVVLTAGIDPQVALATAASGGLAVVATGALVQALLRALARLRVVR